MSAFRPPLRILVPAVLVACWLAVAPPAHATEGGFAATLSSEKQAAAGLPMLSPVELLTLDQLVAGELAAVRRPDAAPLAGTFVSRRTEAERQATGLDRLTGAQLEKLNEYVAAALAARPKPKERPRLKESDVLAAARERNQIHGSVSVTYGWGGGGRDLWAETLWLEYYDPESRIGLGVGLTNFNGNGFYGYYPDYYGYGGRYYRGLPAAFETFSRGGPRGDFTFGEGQSFRGGGLAFDRGGGRRH
jgi:hypothetical protein